MIDACPESAVLFFDVDGTLTSFDPDDMTDKDFSAVRPSQTVIEAFHRLRDAGHKAFICTGRPLWLIADSLRALDPAGVVAMAGARSRSRAAWCMRTALTKTLLRSLRAALPRRGSRLFRGQRCDLCAGARGREQSSLIGTSVVHSAEEMRIDGRLRVGKVCLNAPSLARVANDDGFIDREFELCNTGGQNRELSPKGIDKGVGVARALEYLGREGNARTFGFGDSGNDLGMLAAVETAVAMGNAMPEVKALADYVTDDVAHDGTVTAMQHFGLI